MMAPNGAVSHEIAEYILLALDGWSAGLSGILHDIKLNAQASFEERGKSMKWHHSQNQSGGTCCLPWGLFRPVLHAAIMAQD